MRPIIIALFFCISSIACQSPPGPDEQIETSTAALDTTCKCLVPNPFGGCLTQLMCPPPGWGWCDGQTAPGYKQVLAYTDPSFTYNCVVMPDATIVPNLQSYGFSGGAQNGYLKAFKVGAATNVYAYPAVNFGGTPYIIPAGTNLGLQSFNVNSIVTHQ